MKFRRQLIIKIQFLTYEIRRTEIVNVIYFRFGSRITSWASKILFFCVTGWITRSMRLIYLII